MKHGVKQCVTSKKGTVCDIPSPDSLTKPVVRLKANRDKTAWIATYMGGHVEYHEHDLLEGTEGKRRKILQCSPDTFALVETPP